MTDVTAQAFREAAKWYGASGDDHLRELLLAAAEQREQADRVLKNANVASENLIAEIGRLRAHVDELKQLFLDENAKVAELSQQIATLTAERDAFHTHAVHLREQLDTLTAARDEARATLAQALTLSEAKGQIDTFTLRRLLDAPTRPA